MARLILFLLSVLALAIGLSWLADRPGELVINWEGYEVQTSVFRAVVMFAAILAAVVFLVSILRQLWQSPATVGGYINKRRQKRGLDALSTGMIAIGAGDRSAATRYAIQARKTLPNEPLTHLLRAQAAQLSGDKATARRIFEAMLGSPDTEQLGLRGLFLEAEREGEPVAARQFAERAIALNPKLSWPVEALFDLQCKDADWAGALETLAIARRNGHIEKTTADRRRAVLLTAQAQAAEESDPEKALSLALEAHGLAPELVPAAAIAGRMLASRGNTPRATKIIQRTWARFPHPDLATAYAYARLGDSPRDRLDRVRQLAAIAPNSVEGPIAVAISAIEAKDFDAARQALEPLHDGRLTHRVCLLMARIEGEQHGDKGRVREWFARAVNAPRDPAWTADGVVAEAWAPVSPVTGQLDAFQWRVPVESMDKSEGELLARKLDELVALGAPDESAAAEKIIVAEASAAEARAKPAAAPATRRPDTDPVDAETIEPEAVPSVAQSAAPRPAPGPQTAPAAPAPREAGVTAATGPSHRDAVKPQPSAAVTPPTPTPAQPAAHAAGAPASPARVPTKPEPKPASAPVRGSDGGAALKPAVAPSTTRPEPNPRTSAEAARATGRDTRVTATEPKIFVPPHAPDDPGPEEASEPDDRTARSYRAARAGGS